MGGFGTLALSYAAGALSTLSPCVLPLLPIVLFGALERNSFGPLALGAGLSVSFAAIGIFVASLGLSVGIDTTTLRLAVAVLLLAMGIVLLVPALQTRVAMLSAPVASGGQTLLDRVRPDGLRGQFLLGALLGAIWSPCSGSTLGAAVGLAAQRETIVQASVVMAFFSLGAVTPILALAYGSRSALLGRRDWLARVSRIGKPLMGSALVAISIFVLSGVDRFVETYLTNAMPYWLVNVTTWL